MFDSVLGRGQSPRSRVGLGAVISVVLHVGVFVLVVWFSTRPPKEEEKEVEVTFKQAIAQPMAAAPPLLLQSPPSAHEPLSSARKKTPTRKPVVKKPDPIIQPKESPQETPPEVEPEPNAKEEESSQEEAEGGVEGSAPGGVVGGVVGGMVGGVLGGQVGGSGTDVLPFDAAMTRPKKLSGPTPQYTREALEARVQGLMIVKCVITIEGKVEQCRIIKPLPHMEHAVLEALYATRYQPVTLHGRPVQVDYTFNIRLSLPR